jgi:hypothetical protein
MSASSASFSCFRIIGPCEYEYRFPVDQRFIANDNLNTN